jgi:orsellinic acid C2-O-methyltransferase
MSHLYGEGSFEYLSTHPEGAAIFNEAMAEVTREVARAVGAAYDFAKFHQIVDVGGGNGTLIATILATAPSLRGIIFDLPAGRHRGAAAAGGCGLCEPMRGYRGRFLSIRPEWRRRLHSQKHHSRLER